MNVLHYSFSLSACPKCHLLICKHTSLADLDFNLDQQQVQCSNTTISIENNLQISSQQHLSNGGTNVYIFPSTTINNRYSWTTFGTDFNENINLSSNNETICENTPFANENIINSTLIIPSPTLNQIVQTQSEKCNHIKYIESSYSYLLILFLILSFLITNTIDIVLIYIYYHTNSIYLISFLSIIILCDMILWINNLIQSNSMSFYVLLIPFSIRFYLLYELLELLIILFDKNKNRQLLNSLYKIKKQKLYHHLTLFYFIHTGFLVFINLYIWSNDFQFSTKFYLNMDYFIPQWVINNDLSSPTLT